MDPGWLTREISGKQKEDDGSLWQRCYMRNSENSGIVGKRWECQWFNRRHRPVGHVLQGRYEAHLVTGCAWHRHP